jgi:poly(3-hydroxybutyrate) depolymerase
MTSVRLVQSDPLFGRRRLAVGWGCSESADAMSHTVPNHTRLALLTALLPLLTHCSAKSSPGTGPDTAGASSSTTSSATVATSSTTAAPATTPSATGSTSSTSGTSSATGGTGSTGAATGPTGATQSTGQTGGDTASSGATTVPADTSEGPSGSSDVDAPATSGAVGSNSGVTSAPDDTTHGGEAGAPVPSSGCGKARSLQNGNLTISSGGQNRNYHLKTPANYDQDHPYRLIFMFHWFYGSIDAIVNPPDADHNTDDPYYGLGELAGDSSIFVVPQGLTDQGGAGWANPNNRDVNLADDLLAAVSNDLCVDTSRVFTTGFSFGGAISYKLACVRPDKFRAALVYGTGPISGNNAAECETPIAFFHVHGVDDRTFDYQTGLSVLDIFAGTNNCAEPNPPNPGQNEHVCTTLAGCSEGYPVRFCSFGAGQNNPHNASLNGHYPSPKDPGQAKSWVPGEAWNFIEQF